MTDALLVIGVIVFLMGHVWLVGLSFRQSVGSGILALLIPFMSLNHGAKEWPSTKVPVVLYLAGIGLCAVIELVKAF